MSGVLRLVSGRNLRAEGEVSSCVAGADSESLPFHSNHPDTPATIVSNMTPTTSHRRLRGVAFGLCAMLDFEAVCVPFALEAAIETVLATTSVPRLTSLGLSVAGVSFLFSRVAVRPGFLRLPEPTSIVIFASSFVVSSPGSPASATAFTEGLSVAGGNAMMGVLLGDADC